MTSRRLYAPVVLTLLAAGGLAYFAASRTWASTTIKTAGMPTDSVRVTGADAYPLVSALSLVVIAAAVGVVAAGPRIRQWIGALTFLVALTAAWVMLDGNHALETAIGEATQESSSYTDASLLGGDHRTGWDVVTLLGLGLSAALGVAVSSMARAWPTMGSRYESPGGQAVDVRTEDDLWAALDEGRDPTE